MTEAAFTFEGPKAVPPSSGGDSILDRLRARTIETVAAETVVLPVEQREGFAVAYSKYLPDEQWEMFAKAHQGDKTRFAKAVMVHLCRAITVDGEQWLDKDKSPVTFKSAAMWEALGVTDAFAAIGALYLLDPDVLRTANAVLSACGWDLTKRVDPTQP